MHGSIGAVYSVVEAAGVAEIVLPFYTAPQWCFVCAAIVAQAAFVECAGRRSGGCSCWRRGRSCKHLDQRRGLRAFVWSAVWGGLPLIKTGVLLMAGDWACSGLLLRRLE